MDSALTTVGLPAALGIIMFGLGLSLTIADFRSFIDAQQRANDAYGDCDRWNTMSILNTASSGWFASDRTIGQYAKEIWRVKPLS